MTEVRRSMGEFTENMEHLFDEPIFMQEPLLRSSKVMPLQKAVEKFIRPNMVIHTGQTSTRWAAAVYYEIARQHWGKEGGITLVGITMNYPQSVLVYGNIVRKIITSYCGDPYYAPSPNRVFQQAFKEGRLEIENWSIYTLSLRLKAAAQGVPFLPTHSLIGSTMEEENRTRGSFLVTDDPFQSGKKIGLVKALQPDLTIIHGLFADPQGNAIFLSPLAENLYGAMASREGVLLTVEKIVPPETIRKYSYLTGLPGIYVKSVSEVPFGAHPGGMSRVGMEEADLYGEDYDFLEEAHQASKSSKAFSQWVDTWILSCRSHKEYLKKLGYERILRLKGQSHLDSWLFDREVIDNQPQEEGFTDLEMAVIAMARKLSEKVKAKKYQTLLAGAGIANLAAWLCYYLLKEEGLSVELMAEIGLYGYMPQPTDPAIFNLRNFPTCKMTTDIHTIMGILVGGENNACIGVLGAAQVDEQGNINTTCIGEDELVVGSGGANDVASRAKEVMVIIPQKKERFLRRVDYITSPGKNVRTIISTRGVFEREEDRSTFTVSGYFVAGRSDPDTTIKKIQEECEWLFAVAPDVKAIFSPTERELRLLRWLDPRGHYLEQLPRHIERRQKNGL